MLEPMALLFPEAADLPEGFVYRDAIISPAEESALLQGVRALAFGDVRMRGQVAGGSTRFPRAGPSAPRSRSGRSDATTDRRDFAARARREVRTLTCEGRRWPRGGIVATARKTRRTAGRRARGRTRPQAEP